MVNGEWSNDSISIKFDGEDLDLPILSSKKKKKKSRSTYPLYLSFKKKIFKHYINLSKVYIVDENWSLYGKQPHRKIFELVVISLWD